MSTLTSTAVTAGAPAATATRHRLDDWRPEDPEFWRTTGAPIARRNLWVSIFAEHVGFSVWSLWSVTVLFLGPEYGIDPAGKFLLTAVPAALGAVLRLPYTLAVARFGGRRWTIISALLLLVPTVPMAVLLEPGVSYGTLMVLACLTGVGGGNFASSMANINLFYPSRLKGRALGLNAGGGNLGVPAVQLVGLAVLATAGAAYPRLVPAVYLPLIVLAALAAARWLDTVPGARNEPGALREAARDPHTWVMSLLYVGTFGSFIGFGFAFGQVLQLQFAERFPTPVDAAWLTFLGPLVGSLIRPLGGHLADRLGGARVTFWNFVAMAAGASTVLYAARETLLRALPDRVHRPLRVLRHRQRLHLQDDPGDLPGPGCGRGGSRTRPGGRGTVGAADDRLADRHRRCRRRLRWGARQHLVPPVVPRLRQRRRRLPGLHRLVRALFRSHLGRLPSSTCRAARRSVS